MISKKSGHQFEFWLVNPVFCISYSIVKKSAEDCHLGNYKQLNVYLLTGIISVQNNYLPDGQLPIVKIMVQPTKLVALGDAICLALM